MKVDWVPLGSVLSERRSSVVKASERYPIAGVYGFGRGMLFRDEITGAETKYGSLTRVQAGDLVYSKLKAFEGAVAIADERAAGFYVSPEFPVFSIDPGMHLSYLSHLLASDWFGQKLKGLSTGIGARRERVHPGQFKAIVVPLPSRPDQERIAAHLDSLAEPRPPRMPGAVDHLLAAAENEWFLRFSSRPLRSLAEIAPAPVRVPGDAPVTFVPMDAVDAEMGTITKAQIRSRGDLTSGYRQFRVGDIIFARITPCMQNGKCAIYADPEGRLGYGSTEFHVVRPHDPAHARWLWAVMRSRWFQEMGARSFTGTAGQQRVPAEFLHSVHVPLPEPGELLESTARLLQVRDTAIELGRAQASAEQLASAILPAARNEIFNALR